MEIIIPAVKNFTTKHTIVLSAMANLSSSEIKQEAIKLVKFLREECPSGFYQAFVEAFSHQSTKQNSVSVEEWFEQFYEHYPRKVGRAKAFLAFKRYCKSSRAFNVIMDGLLKYKAKWLKEGTEKQFIPYPATWLNQKRWEDEEIQKITMGDTLSDVEKIFGKPIKL